MKLDVGPHSFAVPREWWEKLDEHQLGPHFFAPLVNRSRRPQNSSQEIHRHAEVLRSSGGSGTQGVIFAFIFARLERFVSLWEVRGSGLGRMPRIFIKLAS